MKTEQILGRALPIHIIQEIRGNTKNKKLANCSFIFLLKDQITFEQIFRLNKNSDLPKLSQCRFSANSGTGSTGFSHMYKYNFPFYPFNTIVVWTFFTGSEGHAANAENYNTKKQCEFHVGAQFFVFFFNVMITENKPQK